MKILCLHGLRQNKTILAKNMEKIIKKLGKKDIVFDFIDSPFDFIEKEFKQWYYASRENALTIDNYDTINESLKYIVDILNKGVYDGILGFSQGSVVCQIFLYAIENQTINVNIKPKFGLLCSTSLISDKNLVNLYKNELKTKTLILNGEKDPIISNDMTAKLAKYLNSTLHYHKGAHYICDKNSTIDIISDFIFEKK